MKLFLRFAPSYLLVVFTAMGAVFNGNLSAQKSVDIPFAGNAFITQNHQGKSDRIGRSGIQNWQSTETVYSVWFHIDRVSELNLALVLSIPEGKSEIRVMSEGKTYKVKANAGKTKLFKAGSIKPSKSGYIRVDIQGEKKSESVFAESINLMVTPTDETTVISYVKDNIDNRFYWGRRGPSVHLSYTMPPDKNMEWFYSEITVPEGEDAIGSYFMANGFAEGYFGMQVNSETERRVIFSVWSPFATDNPEEIPEEDRIKVIRKGKNTIAHDFGNEGSGGHSRIIYPWKAGVTYGFLNSARPDGNGNTIYSAWFFAPELGDWQFLTSFLRPKTDTWLKRAHSFLENFLDYNGYKGRMALYGNQWACDTDGNWHQLNEARLTGDDIARRGYRLDYAGGADGDKFYLRNGGFFHPNVEIGSMHTRLPGNNKAPDISFSGLPLE